MEKRKRAFYSLAVFATTALSFVACASASVEKAITEKMAIETPSAPVTEGGAYYVSVDVKEEPSEIFGLFQAKLIDFFPDGDKRYSAIVGVEYGTPPGQVELTVKMKVRDQYVEQKVKVAVKSGIFPSEKLSVPPRTIAPRPKDQKKIKIDQAFLARAYATKTQTRFWDPPFSMPVPSELGTSSVFGSSRVYNGKKQSVHFGTDMRAPSGTPIVAPLSGRVACAHFLFFTGYTVIIDHGYGLFTIYGHMSKLNVKENAVVKKGETLGLSGMTGRASGPHLHWGVNLHGVKVDPLVLMQALR